ncbi:MAG: membrane-bound lytic murein transglycosylase MltF [Woeseiaceae bacterium]|nr:membrane-bound lytic murein transglycosylase MltF [Woeseiaceae bacterium]NIP21960.1 membrane-bound lytic murein transglycosylase MltF [Woeseiaceae bacterium]NIS91084.1 membrane-bound lytic murein transglycosylase MltF [Woeseiaceae bacterium]
MRLVLYISVAALLGTCSPQPSILEQVLEVGELRVVSRDSPTAYVEGPDGPSGPEYDLVRAFADDLGVDLVIDTVQSVSEVIPRLIDGTAHMAAAGLSTTESRREYVNFGHPYELVDIHLIYKLGTGKPHSIDEALGRTIEVVAGTSHVDTLVSKKQDHPELTWTENADVEVATLLAKVAEGEVDFTVADSTEFNIQRHFYPDLRVAIDLELGDPLAWAFPKESGDSLLSRADDFLIEFERDGLLARVKDRYYGHTDKFDYVGTRNFIRHYESRLPRYREMFEEAAAQWGLDWRLLAAIAYQESHWRSGAVSPTGVRGIMMLTEDTARYLGIEDRVDPRNSIFGGAQYYARQTERVADSVEEPDRTWMALAAYNVGFNHVKDARQIVEWQGGNPDAWVDISNALPLLAKREWYSRVPFGYARGWEPVLYVDNIRAYFNILKWLTANEEAEMREFDIPGDVAPPIEADAAEVERT